VLVADGELLEARDVDGVFVMTFVSPVLTHHEDPRDDLDMASYSLVKSLPGQTGTTYPGMPWERKQSFNALARHFAPTEPGAPIDRRGRCASGCRLRWIGNSSASPTGEPAPPSAASARHDDGRTRPRSPALFHYRSIRGSPKCAKALLPPNQVIAEMCWPSRVRTSIPYSRAISVWGGGK
jgi:hypothetical protein